MCLALFKLVCVKGEKNVVADALSRLQMEPTPKSQADDTILDHPKSRSLAESFNEEVTDDDSPKWTIPISHKSLCEEQRKDKASKRELLANENNACETRSFSADSSTKRNLITEHDRMCVPSSLQTRLVHWHHEQLCHPGETRTLETISQHFCWSNMRNKARRVCSECDQCQRTKRSALKCGPLPAKTAEVAPWQTLCVDSMGPHTLT